MTNNSSVANMQSADGSQNRKGRAIGLILLSALLCAIIVFVLTDVLRKKWVRASSDAQQIVQNYYEEPDKSVDVLMLGASSMRNGFSGLEMYRDYGFTSYSRATSNQLPVISYYLLQETLEKHDIQAVVLDVTSLTNALLSGYSEMDIIGKIHESIDYMPWSKLKFDLIKEILNMDLHISLADFIFPLRTYHERWEELEETDFTYRSLLKDYCYKGQFPAMTSYAHTFDSQYMADEGEIDDSFWIEDEYAAYFEKIIQLCKERGIQIVLVKTPSATWKNYYHDLIQDFANANDVKFIDYNISEIREEIGFDPGKDFSDTLGHLNIAGAKKLSKYLGTYLMSVCSFKDKRLDSAYESWNEAGDKYSSLLNDFELRTEGNLIAYLKKLDNPDYIAMLATQSSARRYYNEDVAEAFSQIGINAPFGDTAYFSYIAVLDGGKLVFEKEDDDPLDDMITVTDSFELDGHKIHLESTSSRTSNKAEIVFDGESLSTNGRGFNFVVYDRKVDQIISQKSFNTGTFGRQYNKPNPFESVTKDPIAYLDMLQNDDYITIMAVAGEGSRYMPGTVNDKLAEMNLIPLDREFNRPYIAVINGSEVVYNEYGDPNTEISVNCSVDNIPIIVVSGSKPGNWHKYISVGTEDAVSSPYSGLLVYTYSKSEQRLVSTNLFEWKNNYTSARRIDGKTNILELLDLAAAGEYDVICTYYVKDEKDRAADEVIGALSELGFTQIENSDSFIGAMLPDLGIKEKSSNEPLKVTYDRNGVKLTLATDESGSYAQLDEIIYGAKQRGLCLFIYDATNRAMLTQVNYVAPAPQEPENLSAVRGDPLEYLAQLSNEDYIAVLGVSAEGSRYMPGVVNDKLAQMGLIPLDKEFNRPYIAVLDGGEAVYNAYGEPGTELNYADRLAEIDIAVVSSTGSGDAHSYVSVGGEVLNRTNKQVGLSVDIYSKSEGRIVSSNRYDWSNNYLAAEKVNGTTNALELLNLARRAGYDTLCVYAPGKQAEALPEDAAQALREAGLDLSEDGCYVGLLRADGSVEEQGDPTKALLEAELAGMPIALTAGGEACGASFGGVEYAARAGELSLYLYDPESRAVLTQAHYAPPQPVEPANLSAVRADPLAYLAQLANEDYIAVLGVSVEGSRYMPGVVNDQLAQMGLIPLDKEFNRPYIAVLDGGGVVYNVYGEPGTELDYAGRVAGLEIAVVSSASADDAHLYVCIDGKTENVTKRQVGLCVEIYSKSEGRYVSTNRYDWSNNHLSAEKVNGTTNALELLSVARNEGYDALCVYAPGDPAETLPEATVKALREAGLGLSEGGCYVGLLHADGSIEEQSDSAKALLEAELAGMPVALTAGGEASGASFGGVAYAAKAGELSLYLYNPANRAVLTQVRYAAQAPAEP